MRMLALFLPVCFLTVGCMANSFGFEDGYNARPPADLSASADKSDSDTTFAVPSDLPDSYYFRQPCPKDMFLRSVGKCRPCTACGPKLYVRTACTSRRDTVCDWCLNPQASQNADFRAKCTEMLALQKEFDTLLEKRHRGGPRNGPHSSFSSSSGSSSDSSSSWSSESSSVDSDANYVSDSQMPMRISFIRPIYGEIADGQPVDATAASFFRFPRLRPLVPLSYKMELVLEICFYAALIVLLYAAARYALKKARKPHYRTVTVNPPVLDDSDNKHIIRAADEIRDKIGKKGYNRLEEFI